MADVLFIILLIITIYQQVLIVKLSKKNILFEELQQIINEQIIKTNKVINDQYKPTITSVNTKIKEFDKVIKQQTIDIKQLKIKNRS